MPFPFALTIPVKQLKPAQLPARNGSASLPRWKHRARRVQDLGRNLRGFGKTGQMDCIDESTNTTTYLYMLEQAGYLKWHTLVDRSTRFGIFIGMPHATAVIEDINTHTRYAVDSWFFDNGIPPAIIELSAWKKGRDPGDTLE
jgi:hypothetical protein